MRYLKTAKDQQLKKIAKNLQKLNLKKFRNCKIGSQSINSDQNFINPIQNSVKGFSILIDTFAGKQ